MPRRTTIKDVAAMAGVSKATVSRVLAGDYPVSEETAQKVNFAVEKLRYTASSRAKSLATGRSNAIAVVISEPLDLFFADPTFSRILHGISQKLTDTEIVPVLLSSVTAKEQEKTYRLISNQTVDAVIHLSPWADKGLLDRLSESEVPVVLCGQYGKLNFANRFASVYSDDELGGKQAAEYVFQKNVRNPVVIMGNKDQPAAVERLNGYRKVYPNLSPERILWGDWSEETGVSGCKEILQRGMQFDCILAGSDRIARGAIAVLAQNNIMVPNQCLVIGYDDNPLARTLSPKLTTISQPMHEQGEKACEVALDLINGAAVQIVQLPTSLIIRETA
ncbi:LacI family DNA-binding transcriptional regulator [Arcanobacterium hippocoleae]